MMSKLRSNSMYPVLSRLTASSYGIIIAAVPFYRGEPRSMERIKRSQVDAVTV
jgi:hypothetical protein